MTGDAPEPDARQNRRELWAAALQERSRSLTARAEQERRRHASVDAAFEMADRDAEVGGGIIAGALAYRLFIWLLPFALVLVAGLGFAADAADRSAERTADELGLGELVSDSIEGAAQSPNRWYALLIGVPILLWVTRSLLRVLISCHRLIWGEVRAAAPKATPVATLRLFAVILGFLAATVFASWVRARSEGFGVLSTLLTTLPYAGLWVLVSLRLPHRDAPLSALLPGAAVFALGVELLHVAAAYLLEPYVLSKQGTYGALGVAAALLFGLFLFSRLIVAAAVVDATLWERRTRTAPEIRK